MQGGIDLYSDTDKASCIMMDTQGNAAITGRDIEMKTQGNLSIGEPDSEGGEPRGRRRLCRAPSLSGLGRTALRSV